MLELLTGQLEDDVQALWAWKELCRLYSSQGGSMAASVVMALEMDAHIASTQ